MAGNELVGENFMFEHMYKPQRAKRLFSRHRDIQAMCERQKKELDWEWHTLSVQMDKEKIRFSQRADRLFKRMRESAERSRERAKESGKLPDSLRIPAASVTPGGGQSVSAFDRPPGLERRISVMRPATTSELTPRNQASINHSSVGTARSNQSQEPIQRPATEGGGARRKSVRMAPPTIASRPITALPSVEEGQTVNYSPMKHYETSKQVKTNLAQQYQVNKSYLDSRVDEFMKKIDKYKEEYRKSLEPKRAATPDLDEEALQNAEAPSNQKGLNSQTKIKNHFAVFANAARFAVEEARDNDKKKEEERLAQGGGVNTTASPDTNKDNVMASTEKQQTQGTNTKSTSGNKQNEKSSPRGGQKGTPRSSQSESQKSAAANEMSRNRVVAFLRNHPDNEKQRETAYQLQKRRTSVILTEAFDAFQGDVNEDNLKKLVALAAKQKVHLKKARARSRSITSIVSAKRAVNVFKTILSNKKKEREGALPDDLEPIDDKDN